MLPAPLVAILELSLLLLLGKLGEEGFSFLDLTPFVGAILIGVLTGPGILKAFYPSPYISDFINLGIVFILFMAGVEETRAGTEIKRPAIAGVLNFVVEFLTIYAILFFLGLNEVAASVLAISLGMVSAGPFSRTLQEVSSEASVAQNRKLFIEVLFNEISAVVLFSFFAVNAFMGMKTLFTGTIKLLAVVALILLFGRFMLRRILLFVEEKFRTREALFAVVIAIILLFGFIAELVGFNSAIAAFFLGVFASEYILNNAYLLEKLRALTYGFFEPMFFAGLGLYFASLSGSLVLLGLTVLAVALAAKMLSSVFTSRLVGSSLLKNFFAITHKGGVDGAILLTALQLSLIDAKTYSVALLAVMIMSVIAPIGFKGKTPLSRPRPEPSIKFVTYELSRSNAEELSRVLPTVSVSEDQTVQEAVKKADELNTRVLVVINREGKPIGYSTVHDLFKMVSFGQGDVLMKDVFLMPVPKVSRFASGSEVLDLFKMSDAQVIAVVDEDGRLVGTILEKEVLRYLLRGG
ncbi:MAG: cation:proton antiporter [Nitrososphaeria archaeon]